MTFKRADGRKSLDIRTIDVSVGVQKHAEGSVLRDGGHPRCVRGDDRGAGPPVPARRREGMGHRRVLDASARDEYAGRPGRSNGESGGRTHEIQRLVGRSLRAVVDFEALGERTVTIDCDVLEADGGTRTASINGAWIALWQACRSWPPRG